MVKYGEIISSAIEWTKTVLFRPFNLKKWLILTFVALLAGALNFSCNFNLPSGSSSKEKKAQLSNKSQVTQSQDAQSAVNPTTPRKPLNKTFIIIIVFLIIVFVIVSLWLGARFHFIFLDNVVTNNAAVKIPFRQYWEIGNSLFKFQLIMTVILLSALAALFFIFVAPLINSGFGADKIMPIIMRIGPGLILFFLLIMVFSIVGLAVNDFIIVIMFKEKIKFSAAFKNFMALFSAYKSEFILYLFVRWGINICASLIAMVLMLAGLIVLLIPGIILAGLCYLIFKITPVSIYPLYFILLTCFLAIVIPAAIYALWCINLPLAVFLRTFSLKFISRLDSRYNLFTYN